jgi:hypothetical protein
MNFRRHGPSIGGVPAARSRGERAVSDRARPLRDLPRARCGPAQRRGAAASSSRSSATFSVRLAGFARLRCTRCRRERLVAFSCKGRGFCPSLPPFDWCSGRPERSRGAVAGAWVKRAAHLVDDVLPDVPVRQWVLTFPHRLRNRLAWDHDGCRAVTRPFVRAVFGFPRPVTIGAGYTTKSQREERGSLAWLEGSDSTAAVVS